MKIAGRNINNLRCAHDTTLMAESKEELKNLLMKTGKAGLKLNIQKTTIIASGPTTSWQNQFSSSVVSNSLRPHGLQNARPPCLSPALGVYSNLCPLSRWCHPTISSSVVPFSSTFNLSQHQGLFKWVSSSDQVAKVLEFQLQHQSFQWTLRIYFL